MKYDYAIGIDPGVNTGYSVWNIKKKEFDVISSSTILNVMRIVEKYAIEHNACFYIENPNLRKWYGKNSNLKLQGAGSIKRDYSIWTEWFNYHKFRYFELNPKDIKTKINHTNFINITKWNGRTNEHSRDSAMMVFGI